MCNIVCNSIPNSFTSLTKYTFDKLEYSEMPPDPPRRRKTKEIFSQSAPQIRHTTKENKLNAI